MLPVTIHRHRHSRHDGVVNSELVNWRNREPISLYLYKTSLDHCRRHLETSISLRDDFAWRNVKKIKLYLLGFLSAYKFIHRQIIHRNRLQIIAVVVVIIRDSALRRIVIGRLRIAWRSRLWGGRGRREEVSPSPRVFTYPTHFLLYLVLLLLLILFHHHHCAYSHSVAGEQYGLRPRTIKQLVSLVAGRLQRILEDLLERIGLDQLAKLATRKTRERLRC